MSAASNKSTRFPGKAKKARKPQSRKVFFESLEDRRVMAFTPGDVFVADGNLSPFAMYNVTGGGNFTGATPLANLSGRSPGQIAWSADLNTAFVTLFDSNLVVAVTSAGTVTNFATNLSGPTGLIQTSDGELLVSEYNSGEVTDITAGGNFNAVTPFATGLTGPRNLVQLQDGRILINEQNSGEVTDITAGGNFTAATPFAFGFSANTDIAQRADGQIFVSELSSSQVTNITPGGDLSAAVPFAFGQAFIGITFDGSGRFLAVEVADNGIYDISAGGNFSSATKWASNLANFYAESALDTVPTVSGSLSAVINGSGNLLITDSDATGKDNAISISNNGAGSLVITDAAEAFASTGGIVGAVLSNGGKTLTVPIASIGGTQVIINGMAGNDTLTANVANALGKIVTFNGGAPTTAPGDKLVVTGGTHTTGTLNHTNATDGSVVLGANTINYAGLEPVDITGTTITDLIINLPDVAGTPDDTELSLTVGGTILTVTSLNATHELDNIALAAFTTVTVNARAGNDTIRIAPSMSTFNKALTINGDDGDDTVVLSASLTAPGTITVKGGIGSDTLDYSAYKVGLTNTAVNFNLTATAANGFSGNVKVGASTITSFTEIDAATGNSATITDSITGLNASATWTIDEPASSKYVSTNTFNFTKFETLNGGTGADDFTVTTPAATAMTLAGGGGTNSLNLSAVAAANVTLTNVDAGGGDGTETTKSITFSEIKTLTADGNGSLTGANSAATWVIDDGATNTYATDLTFAGFKTLTGGNVSDIFNVRNNSVVAYTLNGGAGLDQFNFGQANSLANISKNIAVNGDADGATLTLNDQGVATNLHYTAGATTIGRDTGGTITYSAVTDLTLNASNGSNTIKITAVPTATGTKTINGGTGDDVLNLSGLAANVVISGPNATKGFDGTVTGVANFTGVESFQGNNASTFQGDDETSTWTLNDTTGSTYASQSRTASISGFNTLQGGSKVDTFNVQDDSGALAYTLKGGAGLDAFNFGLANSLANISKNIAVDGEADGGTLTLNDQALATNINYTAGANTIGRDTGGTVTYSAVTDLTLNATNGTNTIKITAIPTATGTKAFNGGTGDDTLDTTGLAANVVVNSPNATKGFDGTITGAGSFTGIEIFKGNNASTFLGDDEISTWTINDTTGSTYVSQSRTATISGFSVLQGGSKVDTFNVQDDSGALAYTLNGGAGLDQFNFGLANSLGAISKNIAVNGEADSATLTLNDQGVATNLNYTLGANTIGRDTGGTVTYSAITDLTLNASNGSNTIKVTAVPTATGVKTLNGGTGDDSLDLTALATTDVTLTAANATKGFNGTVTGVANFTGVEEIKGNGAGDLTGLNETATWTINDTTGHTYVALSKTLKFSGFDNLNGGSKVDTYKVQNNATSNTFTLDGKAGGDKFLIGDTVNKLVGLKNLNVIGGADVGDELTLNDQAEAGASDYSITATTAADVGGVVVSHTTVEKITLNASNGANAITIFDGAYNPATTIKLVDTTGASTLAVDDSADASGNTWTMSSSQVVRTAPTPSLTIDYSSQATITSLSLAGGSAVDNVTVSGTKVATSVTGNDGNDVFAVGGGDLDDNLLGQVTINGGTHNLADTRTVFKGGATPGPADIVFNATPTVVAKGDTLTVNDSAQGLVTKYAVNNTTVSRTGASKSVTYSNIELLNVLAGSGDSDVLINMPTAAPDLPFVVSVDGGGGADNRVQIKGTDAVDAITIGNGTAFETNRSQFEVTGSVTRMWIEGGKGADVIHNRSSVPGLLDGGYAKTTKTIDAGNQDDVIASDAPSTTTFSPVLLGNDGLDFLYTTNSSTKGTTYLVGDYFVNNNVPLTSGSASKTSRLQVVFNPAAPVGLRDGQTGDRYITNHTPASALKNRVLARLDTNANAYSGRFANLTADTIGNHLGVIEWLRGRLPLTVTAAGMAGELSKINYQIRLFTREPGSPAATAFPSATYNPGGVASGGSAAGGEFVDEESVEPTTLVQNPFDAGDVNGDGRITAFDAIIIINELNRNGVHVLDTSPTGAHGVNGGGATNQPLDFLDVNGDSAVSAFDAIMVINRLNGDGPLTYQMPNPLEWFAEADAAEQEAADFAASLPAGLPDSVTDEALLALLANAADDEDSDSE